MRGSSIQQPLRQVHDDDLVLVPAQLQGGRPMLADGGGQPFCPRPRKVSPCTTRPARQSFAAKSPKLQSGRRHYRRAGEAGVHCEGDFPKRQEGDGQTAAEVRQESSRIALAVKSAVIRIDY